MSSWATSLPRRGLRLGHPFWGIMKEISMQFALGYDPTEFASSLHAIAEGVIDGTPMITGEVGRDGVDGAFDELADPNRQCKIVGRPGAVLGDGVGGRGPVQWLQASTGS